MTKPTESSNNGLLSRCPLCHQECTVTDPERIQTCWSCGKLFRVINKTGKTVPIISGVNAALKAPQETSKEPDTKPTQDNRAQKTIQCPYCPKTYKFSDKLVGRSLKCRNCAGIFIVSTTGTTQGKVPPSKEIEAPQQTEQSVPPHGNKISQAKPKNWQSERNAALASNNERLVKQKTQTEKTHHRTSSSHRISQVREALRESGLNAAAEAALAAVDKLSTEKASSETFGDQKSDGNRKSDFVSRVSHSGEKTQRRHRIYLAIGLGMACILALWIWTNATPSPQKIALKKFSSEYASLIDNTSISNAKGKEILGNNSIAPISGISKATLGPTQEIPLTILRETLGDLQPAIPGKLWASPEHITAVRNIWEGNPTGSPEMQEQTLKVIRQAGYTVKLHEDIISTLRNEPMPISFLAELINAPKRAGVPNLVAEIANDNYPSTIEITTFTGNNGLIHLTAQTNVRVRYQGTLLKVSGRSPWTGDWQVATLKSLGRVSE